MPDKDPDNRDNAIFFQTPGRHAAAYPYRVLVGGHTYFTPADPPVARRFHHQTLICTLSGLGEIRVGGAVSTAAPGSVAWLDTALAYRHGCHPQARHWHYVWLGCEGAALERVFHLLQVGRAPLFEPGGAAGARPLFEAAVEALRTRPAAAEAVSNAFVAQIVALLAAQRGEEGEDDGDRIGLAIQAMRADLARGWSVEALASIADLSPSQLHRRFRRLTGTTPMDWLRHERMNHAKGLLTRTAEKIAGVALACGYADPYHFSRDFSRTVGIAPSAFREGHGLPLPAKPAAGNAIGRR